MSSNRSRRRALGVTCALVLAVAAPALASTPATSGTLTASVADGGVATGSWTGNVLPGTATVGGTCLSNGVAASNDHHTFTVAYPANLPATAKVVTAVTTLSASADLILEVTNSAGTSLGVSDNGANGAAESLSFTSLPAGTYDAITCSYSAAGTYNASATLTTTLPPAGKTIGGTSTTAGASTFGNYNMAPIAGTDSSGEPSIGVDWQTGNVFYQANLNTVKAVFPDYSTTSQPKLSDISCITTTAETLDPIMFTDSVTGRVQVSQLTGNDSISAFFDDPTSTATGQQLCTPSQGGGFVSGPDHQTIGGGVYPKPLPTGVTGPLTADTDAVYYCSQAIATAFCARSDDGGLTFGNGVPTYTVADCGGLHGHVRVGPEGNVYLPNKSCNGVAGLAVSTDAGTTWTLRPVTGSSVGNGDPAVSADAAGKLYFAYEGSDGLPAVETSTDFGKTWTNTVTVGDIFGIKQAAFPEVIAGGPGRAAVAFLGSPTAGASGSDPTYGESADGKNYDAGTFHLYVAITVDGGLTYKTVDVTPNDPVQRGEICTAGTTCTGNTRNLLDFMDMTVDKTGHVLVGYSDGCTVKCVTSTTVTDNKNTAQGYIARELDGPLLFAGSPSVTPALPEVKAPAVLVLVALALCLGAFGWRRLRHDRG